MSLTFACGCGQRLAIRPEFVGRQIQCPVCKRVSVVAMNQPVAGGQLPPAVPPGVAPQAPSGQPGMYGQPGVPASQQLQPLGTPQYHDPLFQNLPLQDPLGGYGGLPQNLPGYQPAYPGYSYGAPQPARKSNQNNALVWIIVGCVGGGGLLIVLLAIGLTWMLSRPSDPTPVFAPRDDAYSRAQKMLTNDRSRMVREAEVKREWGTYESKEGRFSVTLVLPVQNLKDLAPFMPNAAKSHAIHSQADKAELTVNYLDVGRDVPNPDQLLDPIVDKFVKSATMMEGTLISKNPIQLGNHVGRDVIVDTRAPFVGQVTRRLRLYWANGRLYLLIWEGPQGESGSADAMRFFDSFTLTGESPVAGNNPTPAASANPPGTTK